MEQNYSNLDRPYDENLNREGDLSVTLGAAVGEDAQSLQSSSNSNGSVEDVPIKSEQSLKDLWIDTFIKSKNWKPKKFGFYLDGETGYAEFSDVYITGSITASTGTIGGFTVGSDYIRDAANSMGLASTVSGGDDVRFWAGDTFANRATAPLRITEAGLLNATGATISGALTATSGAIGGWTINATSIYTGVEDHSGYTANAGDLTIYSDGADASIHAKNFYIDSAGVLNCTAAVISGGITTTSGSSVDGQYLTAGSVASASANLALRGWVQTCAFTVTDADTVAWGAGTFTASDGTAYSIGASNTGNMAAKTYVYLDIAVSTTAYQVTTTAATATGNGKVLVAICQNATGEAKFMLLNDNSYNIDAANIIAGSITANEIAASTITGDNILTLNISGKTATFDTGTVGGFTMGADYLRDTANSFGLASTVSGSDDVRFWAGATFANRATAPARITEAGKAVFTDIDIGNRYITVAVGEDIQDAIDLVSSGGGIVVVLNGTHTVANDLVLSSNVYLRGENADSSIIDFNGGSYQIKAVGSGAYTTGTVAISNNGTTVVGTGTTWTSNVTAGQYILLDGLWYPITVVTDNTHVDIAIPYGGKTLSGASYTTATIVNDVKVENITVKNSATSAIKAQYASEFFLQDVNVQASATGVEINTASNVQITDVDLGANNSGFSFTNTHFMAFSASGTVDDLVGVGLTMNNVTNSDIDGCFFQNSAGDGISITNCGPLSFEGVIAAEAGGQGWEFVSGNTDIVLIACGAKNNASDGIKLTATSDSIVMVANIIKDNGGYGVNIAASTCDNNVITGNQFSGNTTAAANDSGTGTVIRGNVGLEDNSTGNITSSIFGGTGSDGALSISSGTTTLDAGGLAVLTKNYTSISITGTAKVALTNTHAKGTILILKSQGDVTITSSSSSVIDLSGKGGTGGSGGTGGAGISTNGSVGNGNIYKIPLGARGVDEGAGGSGGTSPMFESISDVIGDTLVISCGSGGGGGGYAGGDTDGGNGGAGGGALVIECKGALNFTTGTILATGTNATNGANGGGGTAGGGGGGGGGGGSVIIAYNTLTANSGTITVTGGTAGTGGTGSSGTGGGGGGGGAGLTTSGANGAAGVGTTGGNGGAGGNGYSMVVLNNFKA